MECAKNAVRGVLCKWSEFYQKFREVHSLLKSNQTLYSWHKSITPITEHFALCLVQIKRVCLSSRCLSISHLKLSAAVFKCPYTHTHTQTKHSLMGNFINKLRNWTINKNKMWNERTLKDKHEDSDMHVNNKIALVCTWIQAAGKPIFRDGISKSLNIFFFLFLSFGFVCTLALAVVMKIAFISQTCF